MEKGINKISYKVLTLVLCLCIVFGAAAPAYAAPTTIDQWAQYDGSGWSYNSSSGTFSWNTNMANSSEFVILSYLRDLYSSVKTYNDNLKSGWLFSSNGYSYPSGWSGSFYKVVLDMINSVNTYLNNNFYSNLQSYSSYPLYTYKAFIDSNLYSQQSFSSGNFILNFFSGIASLNNNVAYIANQLYADNASGSYNARSLLNQALHKYVDSSQTDYTSILNNIKTNTDNLSGIKTDTANLSGIKTDTANLSGIKTDTANLFGIKTDTANLSGIKSDIETFNSDYNNIQWNSLNNSYLGIKNDPTGSFLSNGSYGNQLYAFFNLPLYDNFTIFKLHIPVAIYYANNYEKPSFKLSLYNTYSNSLIDVNDGIVSYEFGVNYVDVIFKYDMSYRQFSSSAYNSVFLIESNLPFYIASQVGSAFYITENKDYYDIAEYNLLNNIFNLFTQAKEIFFDDKTIAAKKANQAQEDSVLSNFTGSGAASASVSDFGAVKDSIVDLKAGFTGGASSSDTFSFLSGDSNAWDWFTQDTANDVDRTQRSNNSLLRSSSDVASDTPLLDSYYTSILSILGGDE